MAIKIDLLPGHVKQRRNLQLAILASVCALALVGTGLAMALDAKQKQLQTAQTNLAVVTEIAAKTTAAESEKTAADTTAQPITDTVSFLLAAGKTGPQRAALLNQVRQYIYNDTVINSIDVSDGQQAVIEGTVKNPLEYSRFLLNLRRAGPPAPGEPPGEAGPLFSALPRGVGPGGFNNGNTVFCAAPHADRPADYRGLPAQSHGERAAKISHSRFARPRRCRKRRPRWSSDGRSRRSGRLIRRLDG